MARILIIEDEDNIAVALEFLMTRDGHSHRRLSTGREALAAIRQDHPDLVLLDLGLGGSTTIGVDICRNIHAIPQPDSWSRHDPALSRPDCRHRRRYHDRISVPSG